MVYGRLWLTFSFSRRSDATCQEKVANVRGPRKKKGKGQQAKLRTGNGKMKKIGLMRMPEIEIFDNFAPNPRKFSRFWRKKL